MRIFLTDQSAKFSLLLPEFIALPVMAFDKMRLKEKISTIKVSTDRELAEVDLGFLFAYQIFPSRIMTYLTQWEQEKRAMRTGDTILQQVFIPPLRHFSQKIIFGVRITSIVEEPRRKGFGYSTLAGHVEKGESTFTVEQADGGLTFTIRTYSEPGNFLAKLLGPFFSVPYQAYCTRQALENVKQKMNY